jgi:hypothetical protein
MLFQELLGKTVTVRSYPAVATGNDTGRRIQPLAIVEALSIVQDALYPADNERMWLELKDGGYVNYIYPPNGKRFKQVEVAPPPSTEPKIDHFVAVYSDGTEKILVEKV